ncbi:MAG: hypothetical protein LBS77_03130 [Desulfovibrio sp.]|jgi:hypothetical protein|nr:hypothetical protein [Desulfovibrio sp.]
MPDENTITAEIRQEKGRLRLEAYACIRRSSALREAVEQAGGLGVYVENWLELLVSYARRLTIQSGSPADILRRVSLDDSSLTSINLGVDLTQLLPVVEAEKETAPVWESMKREGRNALIGVIKGTLHNDVTGIDIDLSATNAGHLISSVTRRGIGGPAHVAAVRKIRELVRIAALVKSGADPRGQEDVKNIHRFYGPLAYDDAIYAVNMLVKEYSGKRYVEFEGVYRLYDLKLKSKTPRGLADKSPELDAVVHPAGVSKITLGELLYNVKSDLTLKLPSLAQEQAPDPRSQGCSR